VGFVTHKEGQIEKTEKRYIQRIKKVYMESGIKKDELERERECAI
jgi:hypothetical protein